MKSYTGDDGLKLLKVAGIELPSSEHQSFLDEFGKLYQSSDRYMSLVGTVWEIYSQILPFKGKDNEGEEGRKNYFEHMSRDQIFRENVIDKGLDETFR